MLRLFRRSTRPDGPKLKPPIDGLLPVLTPDDLLQPPHRQALLRQITGLLALPSDCAERYVASALRKYAAFVQEVPASEVHHHSGRGGMLDHGLEVVLKALQIRRGYVLPPGAEPERLSHEADVWSYGVFSAALLHDVGKPVVDQEIVLYDRSGDRLGRWEPWHGPMTERPGAYWYSVRYRRGRVHKLHEPVSSLMAHWILPPEGMSWVGEHQELLQSWIHAIHGHMEDAGALGQIILQADRESVARNLGGESPDRLPTPTKPLHEKLMTSLRHLLSSADLPLNRNGAAGWRTESDLWLVSKRAADALRAQLREEGHSGIPSSNDRIFDTLQEHGLLVANGDRAIWRAQVAGDGWSHELTLIRLPVARLWSEPETMPMVFEGSVTPLGEASTEETTESANATPSPPAPEGANAPASDPAPVEPVAIQTGQSGVVAESHSNPHPAISAGVEDLPLPPGLDGALEKTADEPTAEPPSQAMSSCDTDADTRLPEDPGDACLEWIQRGVADGSLLVNTREARIHVVPEGVLLVSPGIFRDFASATGHTWNAAQKRFQRLQLHEKSSEGTNIHRYVVRGERQTSRINGLLIRDVSVVFGPDWTPSPNDHLTPAAEA
ncbi:MULTISPECIES: MobH family relaxase [unclassified Thioalkalivibrio]|uniref:MobH family relaxase n=1 Tax=unclassified Thioalkalivibrio TaxID=2621013 RepID=UPI00037467C2|nr:MULTISPECIES: MobH family relaxase [unclassified Thioalkalivibrio]